MLPLILAPAALIAPALPPAVQGPAVEGLILDQTGKPLPASIGLIPMFQRDEPFPARTIENPLGKNKKKPGFKLPIPAPGLYLLDIRGRGSLPIQIPVLLGEEGLKGLEITPAPEKPKSEVKPVSPDAKLVKLAAVLAAHREREINYKQAVKARLAKKASGEASESGPAVDWTPDLESLATDLKNEADPDVQALAAACYLDLGSKMAKLDPEVAGMALDRLPPTSPWWAFNPRSAGGAFAASNRSADWMSFREALSRDNPDVEVRAYGYYSQAASAFNKGEREKFDALCGTLAADYKGTKYAKSAKTFDPAKMPQPSSQTPAAVPPVPEPAPAAAPAPASVPVENPIPAPAPAENPAPAQP